MNTCACHCCLTYKVLHLEIVFTTCFCSVGSIYFYSQYLFSQLSFFIHIKYLNQQSSLSHTTHNDYYTFFFFLSSSILHHSCKQTVHS
uniref:Uncharacterized protein n=1 Tax=Octopus bimaculoides TaxID=37653 RepID=A0A0L8IEU8_OCTBM